MPLEVEAELYNTRLKDLQGTDVPRFFGLFTGIIEGFPIRIACILLEYCGPTMGGYFKDYDIPTRGKIIEALVHIHNAGVQHNDFDTYHVILDQSDSRDLKVRIVDFGHADKHTCRRKMEIRPYEFAPWQGDFSCSELYDLAYCTDFWTPTWFSFMGFTVSVFEAYDAKSLAAFVAPYFTLWPRKVLEEKAEELLQRFRDKYRDRAELLDYPFDGNTDSDGSDSDWVSDPDSESPEGKSESEESGEVESGETASESCSADDDASSSLGDKPGITEESAVAKAQIAE
ncbi:hypothetical protein PHLCEN_2v8674 [Hermanssonia centrifuga]|uniref:Protein kinase domain-containing protein n=1 Tax=Hermanssonia centrifuga TaxID=98765 RepID=A0A2R6NT02_9APHY|nr:hypothetical protein PHLCEN_2v8674 [Hermanssonia centrifuga]